jgi:hypothetical protein
MDDVLEQPLAEVLRDLRATGGPVPEIRNRQFGDDYRATATLFGPDGSGQGVSALRHHSPAERLAWIADQVQEWAVEALWTAGKQATWPECPHHPGSHPLSPVLLNARAEWICPVNQQVVAAIGELATSSN